MPAKSKFVSKKTAKKAKRKRKKAGQRSWKALTLLAAILVTALGVFFLVIAISRIQRPAKDTSIMGVGSKPVQYDAEDLLELFAAEDASGIPLEVLGAVGGDYTAAADALTARYSLPEGDTRHRLDAWRNLLEEAGENTLLQRMQSYQWLGEIRRDKVFPLPLEYNIDFANGYGEGRGENGTQRKHEGIDIFADYGIPVVSSSDGTVEKKGWLYLGGWRMGIRGRDGIYYYYAHMSRYAEGLEEGDTVAAGQVIGYVGDSGYGEEGTTGMFAPHLHFGMYQGRDDTEKAFNPYPYLTEWFAGK